ncbi:Auxin Efflux Carrier [Kribbella flavida DSM 17836]|uniref:Auxin Efflux Carrier n=1 Tax=Kribbella flavida (strain DSM 17836 / JCM 10339 / NBRC 14399) TaxID=479435 RepID=D2PMI1_KRIFD|nr:AEC family transporter [Kribbella flavida]ADB30725.1 Auxin Efflux Carrier [Kribbella flavida DSM 17836]
MSSVVGAFFALVAVAVLGYLVGLGRVLRPEDEQVLSRLAFYVATPALLFATVARADLSAIFSPVLLTSLAGVVVGLAAYLGVAVLIWRRDRAQATIGALASSYVNAGNLGMPVAVYVLGDGALVAPIVLFQLLIMAPVAFAVLDGDRQGSGRRASLRTVITRPLRNPLTVASLLGLLVAAVDFELPAILMRPIDLVGAAAVPVALVAYGLSLSGARQSVRLGPGPDLALAVTLKTLVQPAVAYAVGRWALGLEGTALLGPTLLAALPTAQNIYVYAVHYRSGRRLARSAVLLSTLISIPVMTTITGLLG